MYNEKTSPPSYILPATKYTPPTVPIWSLGQPKIEPYAVTTPALKLFFTDLVDLSKSIQTLKFEHTPPQVPTNVRNIQFGQHSPEYYYLNERRACVRRYINKFVPAPGNQCMASEIGELSKCMSAIDTFHIQTIFMCLVEGARDMTLVLLQSDVENLTTALGVLKADYTAAHNAGTDSYWEMVKDYQYLRERVITIDDALAGAIKVAKKTGNQTMMDECMETKEAVKAMKLFKSTIDRGASMALFKGMFLSKKPGAPSASSAQESNEPPPYSSLNLEEATVAESLKDKR